MKIKDTRITISGVMRCCLGTIADEYTLDEDVEIGATSKCMHCKQTFTLVQGDKQPTWKPDWQIEQDKQK